MPSPPWHAGDPPDPPNTPQDSVGQPLPPGFWGIPRHWACWVRPYPYAPLPRDVWPLGTHPQPPWHLQGTPITMLPPPIFSPGMGHLWARDIPGPPKSTPSPPRLLGTPGDMGALQGTIHLHAPPEAHPQGTQTPTHSMLSPKPPLHPQSPSNTHPTTCALGIPKSLRLLLGTGRSRSGTPAPCPSVAEAGGGQEPGSLGSLAQGGQWGRGVEAALRPHVPGLARAVAGR